MPKIGYSPNTVRQYEMNKLELHTGVVLFLISMKLMETFFHDNCFCCIDYWIEINIVKF